MMKIKNTHLPSFNNVHFLHHISLYGTEITTKFRGPAFFCIISEKDVAKLVEF
jgi:hypothetical protein